ncbi:hypothetical protein C3F09_11905 [candidate division GN15 bacterium]|uniref:Lipopolysaccharide heptosyltransferase family protein n=1 Tax=candidate division GN15 bacterium TaxID=2072418 RepID=A0A855X012_9BACT|nr:MAG: hypothetical protein C3F09_11905 [candidate division GN15 bacterium]
MGIKHWVANVQMVRLKRKAELVSFNIPSDLLRTRHILVCLPGGLRELTLVKQFLPTITTLFRQSDIMLLAMPGIQVTDIYPRKGFQIITPSMDQLGWSGLPKRTFLSNLQSYNFDMVLDMNLEESLFTASVLLSIPKAIRVGRGNHLGKPFYNLEIKTKYLRDERNIYRSMLETLGNLMNRRTALTEIDSAEEAQEA